MCPSGIGQHGSGLRKKKAFRRAANAAAEAVFRVFVGFFKVVVLVKKSVVFGSDNSRVSNFWPGRFQNFFQNKFGFIFKSTRTNITKLTPIQQCPCHSDVSQLGSGAGQSGAQA